MGQPIYRPVGSVGRSVGQLARLAASMTKKAQTRLTHVVVFVVVVAVALFFFSFWSARWSWVNREPRLGRQMIRIFEGDADGRAAAWRKRRRQRWRA